MRPRLIAIAAMIGASAFVALSALFAKVVGAGSVGAALPAVQISAARFAFALCAVSAAAVWLRPNLWAARRETPWALHAARSACGWGAVSCIFAAAASIPLADAIAISFLSPIVTLALAGAMLGETVDAARWRAVGLAAIGAYLLVRPGSDAFDPAALYALAAAGLQGLEAILIKRLSGREPPIRILLINNAFGLAIAAPIAALFWRTPSAEQWPLLAGVGLAMAAAQTCFIQAMARGEASQVTPVFYFTLAFAAGYDFLAFGAVPGWWAIGGAGLVVASAILLTFAGQRGDAAPGQAALKRERRNAPASAVEHGGD